MNIGDRLLSILNGAQESIRIAAPFIKAQALTRVLKCVSDNVQVTCIARWRPEDIASGVCDLEIFDIIKERKRSALLIHPHLHAKFYSADAFCLVGSANLSDTALGWRRPSNFELLVEINASDHELDGWWDSLFHEAIEATEEIRSALAKKAVELRDSAIQIAQLDVSQDSAEDNMVWVPECPRWDGLWEVYSGDEEQLTNSAIGSAKSDLEALGLPPGMDKYSFESALKTALRNTQIFQEVNHLSREGLTDDKAYDLLKNQYGISPADVDKRWRFTKDWLRDIYPKEFMLEPQQEVLIKGKDI